MTRNWEEKDGKKEIPLQGYETELKIYTSHGLDSSCFKQPNLQVKKRKMWEQIVSSENKTRWLSQFSALDFSTQSQACALANKTFPH